MFPYSLHPFPMLWKKYECSFWFLLFIFLSIYRLVLNVFRHILVFIQSDSICILVYSFIEVLQSMKRNRCSLELPPICQHFSEKSMLRMNKIVQTWPHKSHVWREEILYSAVIQSLCMFNSKLHQHFYNHYQLQIFYHLAFPIP